MSNFEDDFCRFYKSFSIYMWNTNWDSFHDISINLAFLPRFSAFSYSISHESVTSDAKSPLTPYLGLPPPRFTYVIMLFQNFSFLIFILIICHIVTVAILAMSTVFANDRQFLGVNRCISPSSS